jgi:hypothetical protein
VVVGSVLSYFSTMVTACAVLMAIVSHLVPPPTTFRQPHPVVVSKHNHIAMDLSKPPDAQSLGAAQSSAIATEAVSPEPQMEKQAQYRPRRPSPKARSREHENPESLAARGYARQEPGFPGDRRWSSVAELHPSWDQWGYR